jgi:hypothetical protein
MSDVKMLRMIDGAIQEATKTLARAQARLLAQFASGVATELQQMRKEIAEMKRAIAPVAVIREPGGLPPCNGLAEKETPS